MNTCLTCHKKTKNPKFCSKSCSVTYNNILSPKRTALGSCKFCNVKISKSRTFCNSCFETLTEKKRNKYVERWLKGEEPGGNTFYVSNYIKAYLKEKHDHKCSKCGWGELNIYTGKAPLEINHINHDPFDHSPNNLELLCPNCHALVTQPAKSNAGRGRYSREVPHPRITVKPTSGELASENTTLASMLN